LSCSTSTIARITLAIRGADPDDSTTRAQLPLYFKAFFDPAQWMPQQPKSL